MSGALGMLRFIGHLWNTRNFPAWAEKLAPRSSRRSGGGRSAATLSERDGLASRTPNGHSSRREKDSRAVLFLQPMRLGIYWTAQPSNIPSPLTIPVPFPDALRHRSFDKRGVRIVLSRGVWLQPCVPCQCHSVLVCGLAGNFLFDEQHGLAEPRR